MTFLREHYRHSPWSANEFLGRPSMWLFHQGFERWPSDSPRADMGHAAEKFVERGLLAGNPTHDVEQFGDYAAAPFKAMWYRRGWDCWDQKTGGLVAEERDFVALIGWRMLSEIAAHEDDFGPWRAAQVKSPKDDPACYVEGLKHRLRYTIDLSFYLVDVDLKATLRVPSAPKHEHLRQLGLYRMMRGKPQWLIYASPKKSVVFNLDDDEWRDALEAAADEAVAAFLAIETLNDTFDNPHDVTRIIPLNSDAWQWTDVELAEARKLWTGEN